MKAVLSALLALFPAVILQAQGLDSLDNVILKVPAAWKVSKQATYTELTLFNKQQNSFCQIALFQQQPAAGDRFASFKKEWDELVRVYFEAPAAGTPLPKKLKNGVTVLNYGAMVTNKANNLPYYVELNLFDCGNYIQSMMITSGSKKHLQAFDSSWQSLITRVKKNTSATATTASAPANTSGVSIAGVWAKSSSSPMGIDPGTIITNVGYLKCQYDLKADGTYTLHGEIGGGALRSNNYGVFDESGTYTLSNSQLVIKPAKGKLTTTDRDGKVLKTQTLDLATRTYAWQLHYFEGLEETQLVLKPAKEYFQDGAIAANPAFPNSYLYSTKYKPEWRINLK